MAKTYQFSKTIREDNFEWLHWMCEFSENEFLATDRAKIHVFQVEPFEHLRSVEIANQEASLKGICKFDSTYYSVVDDGNKCAYLMNKNFKIEKTANFGNQKRWLYACAMNKKDNSVMVADRENGSLLICNRNFKFEREVPIQLPDVFEKRISLRDIFIHGNEIYFTDNKFGNRCVHLFDLNYNYLKSFGLGQLENPYSIFLLQNELIVIERIKVNKHFLMAFDAITLEYKNKKDVLDNCHETTNAYISGNNLFIISFRLYEARYNTQIPLEQCEINSYKI